MTRKTLSRTPLMQGALGSPGLQPLQFHVSYNKCSLLRERHDPWLPSPSVSAALSVHLLCRENQAAPAHTHFNLSYPSRVPSAQRVLWCPGLRPRQRQLSDCDALSTDGLRTTPARAYFSSGRLTRVAPARSDPRPPVSPLKRPGTYSLHRGRPDARAFLLI